MRRRLCAGDALTMTTGSACPRCLATSRSASSNCPPCCSSCCCCCCFLALVSAGEGTLKTVIKLPRDQKSSKLLTENVGQQLTTQGALPPDAPLKRAICSSRTSTRSSSRRSRCSSRGKSVGGCCKALTPVLLMLLLLLQFPFYAGHSHPS